MEEPITHASPENPDRDPKTGRFLLGKPPGPGRPVGSHSIKDAVRHYLEDNPEEFEKFVKHFIEKNRELTWQMLEGRPRQGISGEDKEGNIFPILGGITQDAISTDDSPKEDPPTS